MDKTNRSFFVIRIPDSPTEAYPEALFACETLGEALALCKQMNIDAGTDLFAVRGTGVNRTADTVNHILADPDDQDSAG